MYRLNLNEYMKTVWGLTGVALAGLSGQLQRLTDVGLAGLSGQSLQSQQDCAASIFVVFEQSKVAQPFKLKGCTTLDCSNTTNIDAAQSC